MVIVCGPVLRKNGCQRVVSQHYDVQSWCQQLVLKSLNEFFEVIGDGSREEMLPGMLERTGHQSANH